MTNEELAALCQQRTPRSLALFYECMFADRGLKMPDHLLPVVYGLCDTRIQKLMLIVGPGSGKSLLVSVAYPAWSIGYDPTLTILGVSGAENSAATFMQAVMDTVAFSPVWKLIFPAVTPKKAQGWGGERGMFVEGHATGDPDANFWSGGLTSRALTSKHARLIIFDDLHNDENSATEQACKGVVDKYYSLLSGRADPRGARFILAGRRFNQNDLYGHFQNSEEWVVLRLPAERAGQKNLYYDVLVPDGLECVYTDRLVYCSDDQIVTV